LEDLPPHVQKAAGLTPRPKRGRIRVGAKEDRTVDGVTFASVHEARVFSTLKMLLGQRKILLQLQPRFRILDAQLINGQKLAPIVYVGDFLVGGAARVNDDEPLQPGQIVIDAKGMLTSSFRRKRKMFVARYKADIWLVGKGYMTEAEVLSKNNFLA